MVARFNQDFIIYYLSLHSNQVSGELWGKPISTSPGCDEIDYPQAEQKEDRKQQSRFTAVHLSRPDNSLFVLAIDNVFYQTKKVFIELQKEKENASVSRET